MYKVSLFKFVAAIGIGAGSATALHAISVSTNLSLSNLEGRLGSTGIQSSSSTTNGSTTNSSDIRSALESQIKSANAVLNSSIGDKQSASISPSTTTSTTLPVIHAKSGASSAIGNDDKSEKSSDDKSKLHETRARESSNDKADN